MASTKISNLPSQTGVSQTDIVAIVDISVPQTNKMTKADLFRAQGGDVSTQAITNGSSDLLATDGSEIRNNSYTSAVVASQNSYIDDGQNHFIGGTFACSIQSGAAGHSGIVGCDGVSITGGYNHFIGGSYSGPQITGGEENAILASVGGTSVSGQRNAAVATQGVIISSEKNAGIASEGLTISNTRSSAAVASYGGNVKGAYYNFRIGSFGASINDGYNSNENVGDIGGRDNTLIHNRSTMISASGQTTEYEGTAHVDYIYAFKGEASKWYNGGSVSGSFSVDLSTGSLWSFTIGGNIGTIQLNNARIGGLYEFWVYNSGSYTITSINLDGVSSSVFVKSGSVNPTNNGYTHYRLRVVDNGSGGKLGILDEELNYQAL